MDTTIFKRKVNRRIGKTYNVAQLAKKLDAVMICYNAQDAKIIKKEYGVDTISVGEVEKLRGSNKPVLIDQDAAIFEIELLQRKLTEAKFRIDFLETDAELLNGLIGLMGLMGRIEEKYRVRTLWGKLKYLFRSGDK